MLLPESKASFSVVGSRSATISWGHSFGLQAYPNGLSIPESIATTPFQADRMVYFTVSFRPISPCHPLSGIDRTYFFITSGIPFRPPRRIFDGGPSFQVLGPISDHKLHITSLELQTASWPFITGLQCYGPPSYDRYGRHCSSFRISTNRAGPILMPLYASYGHLFYGFDCTCYGQSAINDRVEPPPRNSARTLWDVRHSNSGHVGHSPQHPSFPV